MNGVIGFISLSALLLAVSGQLSTLSPSYSLQGTVARTDNSAPISTGTVSASVDIDRSLRFVEDTITTTGGSVSNNTRLYSENDSATYERINNVCTERAFDTDINFPINTNVWDLFANGTEAPAGTYTFTLDSITHTVTIVNGEPVGFTFSFGTIVLTIVVTNFDNSTPAFSTFLLPSECSQFTCSACYQPPPFPTLSPSYSLQGSLTRSENGVLTSTAAYSVSVDINRRLQFVDETVTTAGGIVSNNLRLSSENDSATYLSTNNVCNQILFNPNVIFPLDTNVWALYSTGTESPLGTYTFTQGSITYLVTIVNGKPALFTFSFSNTIIAIPVTNFDNSTPAFSTFCLPSECSQLTCNACYSSAVSVSISIMLLLTTLCVYLFTTL